MEQDEKQKRIEKALYDRATGFSEEDVAEEYGMVDKAFTLLKRKTNKKYYPPEIRAIEIMMERDAADDEFKDMDLSKLEAERTRLIELLKKAEENDKKN